MLFNRDLVRVLNRGAVRQSGSVNGIPNLDDIGATPASIASKS